MGNRLFIFLPGRHNRFVLCDDGVQAWRFLVGLFLILLRSRKLRCLTNSYFGIILIVMRRLQKKGRMAL